MRKIILGKFGKSKVFQKRLRSSYCQAMKILRPQFGKKSGYDLIFSRVTWTYSDDGIDFYRRQNHTVFRIDERKFRFVRNLDLRNNIIRAISSEELRKNTFKNEFLADILAIGGGFYLCGLSKKIEILPEIRKEILELSKNGGDYDFSKFMDGEGELEENFLGYLSEKIISKLAKNRKLSEIPEEEIFDEIQKI